MFGYLVWQSFDDFFRVFHFSRAAEGSNRTPPHTGSSGRLVVVTAVAVGVLGVVAAVCFGTCSISLFGVGEGLFGI